MSSESPPPPVEYDGMNVEDFPVLGSSPPRRAEAERVDEAFPSGRKEKQRRGSIVVKMEMPAEAYTLPGLKRKMRKPNTGIDSPNRPARAASTTATEPRVPTGPASMSNPLHTSRPTSGHVAGNSTSWVSKESAVKDKYERIQKNAGHLQLLSSPAMPKTLNEYLGHLESQQWALIEEDKATIKWREDDKRRRRGEILVMEEEDGSTRWMAAEDDLDALKTKWAKRGELVLMKEHDTPGLRMVEIGKTLILGEGYKTELLKRKDVGKYDRYLPSVQVDGQGWSGQAPEVNRAEMGCLLDPEKGSRLYVGETTIWGSNSTGRPTAAWPEQNELKAEGEFRASVYGERRLPLPRLDRYSAMAFKDKIDEGAVAEDLLKLKGGDIPWYQRQHVNFEGLDRSECIEREIHSTKRLWDHEGVDPPVRHHSHHRGASKGRFSHGSRGTNSPMSGDGSPGYRIDALASSFAALGSHESGWYDAPIEGRSSSSPSVGYGGFSVHSPRITPNSRAQGPTNSRKASYGSGYEYLDNQASVSQYEGNDYGDLYGADDVASGVHFQPRTPHHTANEPNPRDPAIAWGADGAGDGELPPPGGWKFDEQHLRDRGWGELFDEL